jgi:ferric-dicitrate binding protein FerR (iron transport regulator)
VTETDKMLLRYRLVAENDESIERQADDWLAIILKDPSQKNALGLLSWAAQSQDNALQFQRLLNELQKLATLRQRQLVSKDPQGNGRHAGPQQGSEND